jgi:hypothetical protein
MNQNQPIKKHQSSGLSLPLSFRLPINEAYRFDDYCRTRSINKSSLMRKLLENYLPPQPDEQQQAQAQ